jgi:anti-sigma regulatory factor (Ser/Thr protein kinase)
MAVELADIAVDTGEHVVQFYEHESDLARTVGRYLGAAVQEGGVAVAITTAGRCRLLEAELEAAGLDPAVCRAHGTWITLDAADTMAEFVEDGVVDPDGFRRVVGSVIRDAAATGKPVRAFGEMVALLWEAGNVLSAIELEKSWNELTHEVPFALICAYRSDSVQGDEVAQALEQVCHLHSSVLNPPTGSPDLSARFPAEGDAPRRARHLVADALEHWGKTSPLLNDAQLVVTELAANAVVHARSPFSVELWRRRDGVRLAVRDASRASPILRDLDPLAISGRGLRIVAALAAAWGVQPDGDGKTVWAELRG